MIDFHRIIKDFPGRINDDDCGLRCSGVHRCCAKKQALPLLPGEGAFLAEHGFDICYNAEVGCDFLLCPGKDACPGKLRPVVCRTFPIHPGAQGLKVDTDCSEHLWLNWDFIEQMEKMWRYLIASDTDVLMWVAKFEELVWSKKREVPLYRLERSFGKDYYDRLGGKFVVGVMEDVIKTGWIREFDRVLDAGGGAGARIPVAGPYGVHLEVLDINPDLARVAGGVAGDVCSMPFNDGEFDVVFCFDVLEHLPDSEKALAEMLRVSKDRVIIYVTTLTDYHDLLLDVTHCVFKPFSEWLRLFDSQAEIVAVDYYYTGALLRKRQVPG